MYIYCVPKYLTITEARRQLLELPGNLAGEPIIIIKRGKPVMVALSYDQFESLLETLDILSDAEFCDRLQESISQANQGKTISWEEAKTRLEF